MASITREEVNNLLTVQRESFNGFVKLLMDNFEQKLESLKAENCQLKTVVSTLQSKVEEVEKKTTITPSCPEEISLKLNDLEDRSRRNNLKFEGFDEEAGENWEQCAEKIKRLSREKLGLTNDIEIERAHRLGKVTPNKTRPIIAKFLRFQDREAILKSARKLKGTNIYINEDLCEASLEKRREQLPRLKAEREKGNIAYFSHTRLVIKRRPEATSEAGSSPPSNSATPLTGANSIAVNALSTVSGETASQNKSGRNTRSKR